MTHTPDEIAAMIEQMDCKRLDALASGEGQVVPYDWLVAWRDMLRDVAAERDELSAQLKTVLDREAAAIARHDAKFDALESRLAASDGIARIAEHWIEKATKAESKARRLAVMIGKLGDYAVHEYRCDIYKKRACCCGLSPILLEITAALQESNNG